jgi:phage antirepressor YoqD-like protein
MNLVLTNNNGVATMTSLQMVDYINALRKQESPLDYTELLHKSFMEKIPKVLKAAAINFATASYEVNNAKRERQIAVFEKREAMLMAMSYSYDIQASVYDSWEEAEKKLKGVVALPDFTDPVQAAEAFIQEYKAKKALQIENEVLKPKAIFHDRVVESEGTKTMEEVAKSLGIGRNTLFKLLRSKGILCNNNLPTQYYLDRKWFEVTTQPYKRADGDEYLNTKTVVTGKGITEISKLTQGE